MIDEDAEWVTHEATDPNFGSWERKIDKDDNQKDFLGTFYEAILYAWKVLVMNELHQYMLAILDLSQVDTVDLVVETSVVVQAGHPIARNYCKIL